MSVSIRNNIFHLVNWYVTDNPTVTHTNNLFSLTGGGLGFTQHSTEKTGNPLFVNLAGGNYDLLAGSPAINIGSPLGFALDFLGRPALIGSQPDAGAFEYQGSAPIFRTANQSPHHRSRTESSGLRMYDVAGKRLKDISLRARPVSK
jgi:hypothetical protein